MRLFVALELPPDVRQAAGELARELKRSGADVKWVKPETMHLTLKFLGEVPDKEVPAVTGALERALAGREGLELALEGCGAFPSPKRPQVVWLGVAGQVEELKDLARAVESELARLGFPPERRSFKAHLTLGRLRRGRRGGGGGGGGGGGVVPLAREIAARAAYAGPAFRADWVALMKSTLTPAGPIYEPLAEFDLA